MRNSEMIEIHMLKDAGNSFKDIANKFKISAFEAAQAYVSVVEARKSSKNKIVTVYRKRLSKTRNKLNTSKLVNHMRNMK